MWIVFGVNELSRDHGTASRYCLRCRKVTTHGLVSVQAWFSLFFIPVIPLGPRSYLVRCGMCGQHLPELGKPLPRWTLAPRHRSARFRGWVFTVIGTLWSSIIVAASVASWLSDDPSREKMPILGLICGLLVGLLPLTLGLLCFRRAARLRHAMDVPETEAEKTTQEAPPVGKKCPRCAEEIPVEAKVCRHCRHEFDEAQITKARQQAEARLQTYTQRLERQARLAELTQKRLGFLIAGWISVCSCILSWLGLFLLWKARQLKEDIRALEANAQA